MKFHSIIVQLSKFIGILILCLLFIGSTNAQNKTDKKAKPITLLLQVNDVNGLPIPNAQVVVGEGVIHSQTDNKGQLSFQAAVTDIITVMLTGYEQVEKTGRALQKNSTVILLKSKIFMTSDDDVNLPFLTVKKRNMTGSATTVTSEQLDKYPTTDLRNSFSGLVPGLEIIEKFGSTGMNAEEKFGTVSGVNVETKVSLNLRGRTPIYIIDGIQTDINEVQLDPLEIESVTVLKDIVSKTMFGPQAADGIILIKTKRGKKNERILKVNTEYGVSLIDRFPGFVSGADYATLNNQARTNSNLTPNYSPYAISRYAENNPYDMYYPSTDYRSMMIKNQKSITRTSMSSQGGNDAIQYFADLAYDGDGDIYKIGPAANYNRISTRANLDVKINNLINIQFDFYGGLTIRNSSNYSASGSLSEMDVVLNDINTISPIAFPVYANNDPSLPKPWYGVSNPTFPNNPIGRIMQKSSYSETGRSGNASLALNYDLKNILKGLKSKSFIGFQTYNLLRLGKNKDYIAYNVTPIYKKNTEEDSTYVLTKTHDGIDVSSLANLHDYYYQRFTVYENLNYDRTFGNHDLHLGAVYNLSRTTMDGIEDPRRIQNTMLNVAYTYDNKYSIEAVANYAGTYSFAEDKRYGLFHAIGLSCVLTEENFMKDIKFLDFLKLRAEIGQNGYDANTAPFYYNSVYQYNTSGSSFGPAATILWFGSSTDKTGYQTYPSRIGNPDLTWETRKELNLGLEALLFKSKLSVEISAYNNLRDGIISQLTYVTPYPYIVGASGAKPYANYNQTRYMGIESALQYTDKIGNFEFSLGGNATLQNSRIEKIDEPAYRNTYQSHLGQSADGYYGLTYIGKFQTDAETLELPQTFDATLHAGDLKYKDMNDDKIIDANDVSLIGHTTPSLFYSTNIRIGYKAFELTIVGTGRAFYDIPMTNKYFWNGWGNNTYSNFVRDNIGGAYPRLTYNKVENNFQPSTFWLMKGDFYKIQNIEIAYTLAHKTSSAITAKNIRFFVRGANLLTISKVKDVDPESVNSGIDSYPLFKTYTAGVKLTF